MKQLSILLLTLISIPVFSQQNTDAQRTENERLMAKYRQDLSVKTFDPIREKVALISPDQTPFSILIDQTKPTEGEKVAILEWGKRRERLYREQDQLAAKYENPYASIIRSMNFGQLLLTADLYNGSLTYGEFNKRRMEIYLGGLEKRDRMQRLHEYEGESDKR